MSLGCLRAGKLLAGRKAGLSEAERLWLEEHLQACGSCHADAHALAALTELSQLAESESMGDRTLGRLVGLAMREGAQRSVRPPVRPLIQRIALSFSIATAVATAGVVAWVSLREPPAPALATQQVAPAPPAPVPVPERDEPRVLPAGETVKLAHAEVLLDAGGAAEWDATSTTVRLHSGRVSVHVDKRAQKQFRVATARFVVEVTGTRFDVAADSVEVHEGSVRVLALDGSPLAESLSAGGRWQIRESSASVAPSLQPPPATAPRNARPAPGHLLDDARRVLARGDAAGARRLVGRALDASPTRGQRAEAETLLAEATLVEGDRAAAVQSYARVAERFADLPAGENALYAAATLAARSGRSDDARALAEKYLTRYPRGRFRGDAEALRDRAGR